MSNLVILIEEVQAGQILDLRLKHLRVKLNYSV